MTKLWLGVMAIAACGEVKANHLPDAPGSGSDAATIDGSVHGIVTVNVLDPTGNGAPAIGAPVIFIDAAQTQKVATGNDGKAMADVLEGASVTAVLDENGSTLVESILGVKPGDNLTLGDVNTNTDPPAGTFTVNFSGVTGQSYEVFGPCGEQFVNGPTSTVTLTMTQSCVQSKMDLLIIVNNAAGLAVGYAESPNITFNNGGSISMDTTNLKSFSTFDASYTNVANISSINFSREAPDGFGFPSSASGQVTGTTLPLSAGLSPLTGSALIRTGFSEVNNSGAQQTLTQSIPGNATTFGLDVDTNLLGWLGVPTLDVASNNVTVVYDQSMTSKDDTDISLTEFFINRPPATDAGAPQGFIWLVFAATPTSFTLPTLPVELGDLNPKAGDVVQIGITGAVESDGIAGYDIARQDPFSVIETTQNVSRMPTGTSKVRFILSPENDFAASHRHLRRPAPRARKVESSR